MFGPFGVVLKLHNSVGLFFVVQDKFCSSAPDLVSEHLAFEKEGRHGYNGGYRITGQPGNHLCRAPWTSIQFLRLSTNSIHRSLWPTIHCTSLTLVQMVVRFAGKVQVKKIGPPGQLFCLRKDPEDRQLLQKGCNCLTEGG